MRSKNRSFVIINYTSVVRVAYGTENDLG